MDRHEKGQRSYTDVPPRDFNELLSWHLKALNVRQEALATAMGVNSAQLSRLRNGSRPPTRNMAARIAFGLCRIAQEQEITGKKHPSIGPDNLDVVLGRFLSAAGFGSLDDFFSPVEDLNWREIQTENRLKVGWVPCPPWLVEDPVTSNVQGASAEAMRAVAALLKLRVEWCRLDGYALESAIASRKIHISAPYLMVAPWRLNDYVFSDHVFEHQLSIKAVVKNDPKTESVKDVEELIQSNTRWTLVLLDSGVGQLASMLLPKNPESTVTAYTIDECVEALDHSNEMPLFVGGETVTGMILRASKGKHRELPFNSASHISLPLAFALHPHEPSLLRALNAALKVARKQMEYILDKHSIKNEV